MKSEMHLVIGPYSYSGKKEWWLRPETCASLQVQGTSPLNDRHIQHRLFLLRRLFLERYWQVDQLDQVK